MLILAASCAATAQDFMPAPVDLTGKVPADSGGAGIKAVVNQQGELFVLNPGGAVANFLTHLVVTCEIDCLNPDGYVALSEQAAVPVLADQYVGLYGVNVLDSGFPDYERQSTSEILAFGGYMDFPIGEDKAFSLGRIVDGTPTQILQWVEDEEIVIHWQKVQLGLEQQGEFPVHYTTFVPEPSTIALAALGVAGLLLVGRHRAGATAGSPSSAFKPAQTLPDKPAVALDH